MWYSQFNFQFADELLGVVDITFSPLLIWIYIYQKRTIIYILKWAMQQKDIHASFALIVRSWKETSSTTMFYVIVFLKKPWCVIFVNLLENQQTLLYCTLYRYTYILYRLPNQFTVNVNLWCIENFNAGKSVTVLTPGVIAVSVGKALSWINWKEC